MQQEETLLARQPIFNAKLDIYAYELLFRPATGGFESGVIDGDHATSTVMLNAFSEVGISNLVAENKAFINFTRNLILTPPPFSNQEIVIEVLEDIAPDPEVLQGLERLRQQGFTIALDDFAYDESLIPLIKLAHIVKVDVLALNDEELDFNMVKLRDYPVKLLAEKVETQEMFQRCKALGFDYFQGYFLSKPILVKGRVIPANKLVVMKLIADLHSPETSDPSVLHDTISSDTTLSYKLLKMINSAAYRRPRKIESLYRAILLIGPNNIKHWASLLALSNLDDKPHALHEQTMLRAHMCENLGSIVDSNKKDLFFTVGMMSMLDAFFDAPLDELLSSISLTDDINAALLNGKGPLGFVLSTALAYEQGCWGDIDWSGLSQHNLTIQDVKQAYLDSLQWSIETSSAVKDSA